VCADAGMSAVADFLLELLNMSVRDAIVAVIDIALISYLFYRLIQLIRGTRAIQLIQGIVVLLLATVVSYWLRLNTVNWLLQKAQLTLAVAIPIVFQPELRRALEQVGRGRLFISELSLMPQSDVQSLLDEVVEASRILSRTRVGAIIVIERETGLSDIAETGIAIDAVVSAEFLVSIFIPNTPLHDGAVIIRGNRAIAAACFLPLVEAANVSPELGSRHRAALGISEQSDALAIVVSEETGALSLANAGKLIRSIDVETLRDMLETLIESAESGGVLGFLKRRGNNG